MPDWSLYFNLSRAANKSIYTKKNSPTDWSGINVQIESPTLNKQDESLSS